MRRSAEMSGGSAGLGEGRVTRRGMSGAADEVRRDCMVVEKVEVVCGFWILDRKVV